MMEKIKLTVSPILINKSTEKNQLVFVDKVVLKSYLNL